jgi:hypothetical protein
MVAQTQEKPTAAFVLSLIGGILGIVAGIILIIIGLAAAGSLSSVGYYGYTPALMLFAGIGIWGLVSSSIVIGSAAKLNSHPLEHTKWGAIILVFSIIGLTGLFGLIGGIVALAWKPSTTFIQPPMQQQVITRICPKCGRVVNENTKFCPYCGNNLGEM